MEKITVGRLMQLAESELVLLAAPPGSGKTTLLKFVSSFIELPILDTDAIGYRKEEGGVWIVDPGALRKMGSHMRHGIIAGWCSNIKEVVEVSRDQGWLLVGWDLAPDERQRILNVSRQRLSHERSLSLDDPTIPKSLKIAMNLYRKFKFPYLLRCPEEVYRKSNFQWEQASGKAPVASDLGKIIGIVKDSWTDLRGWVTYRKKKGLKQSYLDEVESILKSSGDRDSSRRDDVSTVRDSK